MASSFEASDAACTDNAFNNYFTHKVGPGLDFRNDISPVPNETGHYFTEIVTANAIGWLEGVHAENASRPTFAYLAHESNHAPMQVPPSYIVEVRLLSVHCCFPDNAARLVCLNCRTLSPPGLPADPCDESYPTDAVRDDARCGQQCRQHDGGVQEARPVAGDGRDLQHRVSHDDAVPNEGQEL